MTRRLKIISTAHEAMILSNELKADGLTLGIDFDWEFHPSINDRFTGPPDPSYVLFTFYDDAVATFYELKWI